MTHPSRRARTDAPRRARLAGALLAVAVAATAALGGPAAAQSGTTTTTAPTTTTTRGATSSTTTTTAPGRSGAGSGSGSSDTDPTLRLLSQSGFVAPTGMFRVQLSVPPVPAGSTVTARMCQRVTTASALDQSAQNARLCPSITRDVTVPVAGTVTPGTGDTVVDLGYQLASSGSDPPLGFTIFQAGVYPVQFRVLDGSGREQARLTTHLVRLPDTTDSSADPTPLTVSLVVPLSAPVAHQPDGTIDLPDDQAAALRAVVTTLNRYPSVQVSLAPTPETMGALVATDRSDTNPIGAALRTAAGGGRQVISGAFVPVASSSWIDQGLGDRYDQELAAGADQLRAAFGTAPDQATASLDATTSPAVLSALATAGVSQAVVPRDRLSPTSKAEEASTLTQTFDLHGANGEHIRTVATDSRLSDALATATDPVLGAHEVLAALSLIALDSSGGQPCVNASRSTSRCSRGVALQLPADAATAQPVLDALLASLNDRTGVTPATGVAVAVTPGAPVLSPMTVSNLIGVVDAASSTGSTGPSLQPRERQLVAPETVPLGAYPSRLQGVAGQVAGFHSMIVAGDPTGEALARSLDMVVLSSGALSLDDGERLAYLDGAAGTVRAQTDQITTPEQQVVTLTSGEGVIPLSINNPLPYPVLVTVTFASAKLEFPGGPDQTGGPEQPVSLPANTSTPIRVHVRVRASGAFPLEVTVRSPDKTLTISTTRFTVRSTAVSGLGLVLTIVAGLFLLLWWARHFRDGRRARRLVASTHPVLRPSGADAPPEAADGSGEGGGAISYAPADTD